MDPPFRYFRGPPDPPRTNQTPIMGPAHLYLLSTIDIGPNRAQTNPYSAKPARLFAILTVFDRFWLF